MRKLRKKIKFGNFAKFCQVRSMFGLLVLCLLSAGAIIIEIDQFLSDVKNRYNNGNLPPDPAPVSSVCAPVYALHKTLFVKAFQSCVIKHGLRILDTFMTVCIGFICLCLWEYSIDYVLMFFVFLLLTTKIVMVFAQSEEKELTLYRQWTRCQELKSRMLSTMNNSGTVDAVSIAKEIQDICDA